MCLFTNKKECDIAKEDIICYKVLRSHIKFFKDESKLYSPIRNYYYCDKENIIGNKLVCPEFSNNVSFYVPYYCYSVDRGIHGFKDKDSALVFIDNLFNITCNIYYTYYLYECIIPKGSKYYEGINNDICSEKMIVNKLLLCKVSNKYFTVNLMKIRSFFEKSLNILKSVMTRWYIKKN